MGEDREACERTFDPSLFSISNLCCNMTISLSPSSYCILASSVAQSVSRRFPLVLTDSEEKIPIHRSPETIRSSSAGEENLTREATLARRHASEESEAESALAVISFCQPKLAQQHFGLMRSIRTDPSESLTSLEVSLLLSIQESKFDQSLDESRETLISQSPSNNRFRLRDLILLSKRRRISIGVSDEGESGSDEVGLSVSHEILTVNFDESTFFVETG